MLLIPFCCALCCILYASGMRASLFVFSASVAVFVASTLLSLFYLISDHLTGAGITEATLFHVLYGLGGLNWMQISMYAAAISFALIVGGILCVFAWRVCKRKSEPFFRYKLSAVVHLTVIAALSVFAVAVHPATTQTLDVSKQFFDTRYVALLNEELRPVTNVKPPQRPKSLIYIYGESLERTFFNEKHFPDLMPSLSGLERSSLSIRGIHQTSLSNWTIAGMVASQCGMPLATFRPNRNDLSDIDAFVPGATCVGDILHRQGYELAYLGGADLEFASKGQFYHDHNFKEVTGLTELQAQHGGNLPVSKWGVYDDALFDEAYLKFKRLAKGEKPFAMFILTLDTHAPNGHVTPACANKNRLRYRDGSNAMLNAVKCTDHLISRFLKKIEAEAGDDLVIVVASDHLQMQSDATMLLLEAPQRENLFMVRSKSIKPRQFYRNSTTMDIAPTVLSLLGWEIDALAFGRNLLKEEQTLPEKYGMERFNEMILGWRMSLWKMWQKPAAAT